MADLLSLLGGSRSTVLPPEVAARVPIPVLSFDLTPYDLILLNSSGGKDSCAMLAAMTALAEAQGVRDRLQVIHADLGEMEWAGSKELVHRQAEALGLPVVVVTRIGQVARQDSDTYKAGEVYGDLLDYVQRRKMWPDRLARYCTSEFKRAPIQGWIRAEHRRRQRAGELRAGRAWRVLNCLGMRAEESPARRRRPSFTAGSLGSTKPLRGRYATRAGLPEGERIRQVDEALPIHAWATREVWAQIHRASLPYPDAYDKGMSRYSCCICALANKQDRETGARENPHLLTKYLRVQTEIGQPFQPGDPLVPLEVEDG